MPAHMHWLPRHHAEHVVGSDQKPLDLCRCGLVADMSVPVKRHNGPAGIRKLGHTSKKRASIVTWRIITVRSRDRSPPAETFTMLRQS